MSAQLFPRPALEKLLADVLGDDVTIQKETLDWVNDCAAEFLHVVGAKANALAEEAATKENYRIAPEHVVAALEELGKQEYVDAIEKQQRIHEVEAQKKKQRVASRKAAAQTLSREEMLAEQNELFKQASMRATKEGW